MKRSGWQAPAVARQTAHNDVMGSNTVQEELGERGTRLPSQKTINVSSARDSEAVLRAHHRGRKATKRNLVSTIHRKQPAELGWIYTCKTTAGSAHISLISRWISSLTEDLTIIIQIISHLRKYHLT